MSFDFSAVETAAQQGAAAALDSLIMQLTSQKRYHELFEALKMQVRQKLGLPLIPGENSSEACSESVRNALEDGLVAACKQVGEMLLRAGSIREGWMYFRPVGDKAAAAQLIAQHTPDEDTVEEFIEVLLHEGVDTARGFQLLLEQNGTCNAITMYDQLIAGRSKVERQAAANALLHKLHTELLANVKADIARQEGTEPRETTLAGLVADRDWLFDAGAYHIDTTHLAAVVRMARVLEDKSAWQLAWDLTAYGRQLAAQLQYQGDEPFVEQYPTHALFFEALLGTQVDNALKYFREKAELLDPEYHGTAALETYLELLTRLGQHAEALQAAVKFIPSQVGYSGYAPVLLELATKTNNFMPMLEFCRQREDLLGFTAAVLAHNDRNSK